MNGNEEVVEGGTPMVEAVVAAISLVLGVTHAATQSLDVIGLSRGWGRKGQ